MSGTVDRSSIGPEIAYIDESGDTGAAGSSTYSLGCLLIPMHRWTDSLDQIVATRRELRDAYGLPMQAEVKANHLVGVKKTYTDLGMGDGQVRDVFIQHVQTAARIGRVGSVVIHKSMIRRPDIDVFTTAWEYMFTRLRARTEASGQPILIVHDEGEADRVRKHLRKFRRANWQGRTYGQARLLIEDPVARDSQHSYFVQLADLIAYTASRHVVPASGKTTRICDQQMWARFGDSRIVEVSSARNGIYKWPA